MTVGIIGAGAVGTACAKAMILRGSCQNIVLHDIRKDPETQADVAEGVVADLSHAATLCPPVQVETGSYESMSDADVVVITAGWKERDIKEAIDPKDPKGRNRLVKPNAKIVREIVPQIDRFAREATILVVTDPPDPLADVARELTTRPVLSSGTYLDTLRFRLQIAKRVKCHIASIDAMVLGEHGLSQVYVWSSILIDGVPIRDYLGEGFASFREEVEHAVRFANIAIINGTGASQHGIGVVTARIIEAMLRDEKLVAPIGKYHEGYGVTLSLPSVIGSGGVSEVLEPKLSPEEQEALGVSAAAIKSAFEESR